MPKPTIISGGQTGVDQAALAAAKDHGYPTGGAACQGWMTEQGPALWLADYGLVECDRPGYPVRTKQNVADADITVIFDSELPNLNQPNINSGLKTASRGTKLAMKTCRELGKDYWQNPTPEQLATYIATKHPAVVNVAGNRASRWAEGYDCVYGVLSKMFALLEE